MQFAETDVKKIVVGFTLVLLAVLVYIIVKPVFISVITGLLLAYILLPVYRKITKVVKNKNFATWIVLIFLIIILILPFWFFLPEIIEQIFSFFKSMQTLDVAAIVKNLFPSASDQFVLQVSLIFNDLVIKATNLILSYAVNLSVEIPIFLVHLVVVGFVFFFAIRDHESLMNFMSEISPFSKSKQSVMVSHFKNITDGILYGQVVSGIVQGFFAGIGFYLLGLDNALLLTLFAVVLSILPFIGVFVMWIPICLYLFTSGQTTEGILYFLYNFLIVSNVDNIVRTYVIAKRTEISQAIIFVGMMGGLFIFGIIGIILGPLILGYFFILLKHYKERTISTLFSDEKSK